MFKTKPAIVKAAISPATQTKARISRRSSAESISSLEKYGCTRPTPVAIRPTRVTAASRLEYGKRKRRARPYCLNQIRVVPADIVGIIFADIVGAVYDRAICLACYIVRGHTPRLQVRPATFRFDNWQNLLVYDRTRNGSRLLAKQVRPREKPTSS